MNAKLQKFYKTVFDFAKSEYMTKPGLILSFLQFCLDYDFGAASDMWEFLILENEQVLAEDTNFASVLGEKTFALFLEKSEQKTYKLVADNSAIKKALFLYSQKACEDATFKLTVDFLFGGKIKESEEILKYINRNTVCAPFGPIMRDVVERLLIELMKKANAAGKKLDMPKKTSALLLSFIAKIKGPEKPLLEQRIKEIY